IRPGVTAHDAHMLCKRVIDDGGLGVTLNHRAAYSIGIAFAPDWGEGHIISMTEGEQRELRAGMTFHLIPSVFLPGLTSVGMSETVLVTETGCEAITGNVERKLFSK
ncbi:MAG: M24 family metallopeptidase, partial [Chloroflexi bacterium]|nr:M24 family metallopeptidase [Chloroflexota bacterium]